MNQSIFEDIKRTNEYGKEYRWAREFAHVLGYDDFDSFGRVINRAQDACLHSGQALDNHFGQFDESIGEDTKQKTSVSSRKLSRYACYLVIQNADPSKEVVASGQTYFALQTRKQEVSQQTLEDHKRVQLRGEMATHNKKLFSTASRAGVSDFAEFYDYGYMGLYGMRKAQVAEQKGVDDSESMLDYMDSEELAANLFRATQAEAKIKREKIRGQEMVSKAHFDVGKKIRGTIKELGGTMPEEIKAVEHVKHAQKRLKELAYQLDGIVERPEILLRFDLPNDVGSLQHLVNLINHYPGGHMVTVGKKQYGLSSDGVEELRKFFDN